MALVRRQLLRQRVALDGVEGRLRQRQVAGEVGQVAAVVLAHEEELLRVADDGGADARTLETRVLLDDGHGPAVVLAELGVAFGDDLLAAGGVEKPGELLEQDPFPLCPREREDVLPAESADEQSRRGLQLDGLLGDEAQLEVRDLSAGARHW